MKSLLCLLMVLAGWGVMGQEEIEELEIILKSETVELRMSRGGKQVSSYKQPYNASPEGVAEAIQKAVPQSKGLFLYVHSLYGHAPIYSDIAEEVTRSGILEGINLIPVIVTWGNLNPLYSANQSMAKWKGMYLGEVIHALQGSYKIHVLSHSMGNILMQSALSVCEPESNLGHWYLMAADVDRVQFENSRQEWMEKTDRIIVFVNQNDLFLVFAELINQNKRLGRSPGHVLSGQLEVVDVTDWDCLIKNHVYWLTCPQVIERVNHLLSNNGSRE